ncbi:arylsulfatase [Puniceicoccales bacterium CK1056]|uniref:Arylsulfatase n=1 Tax=Oceanipulchritudo coccoides TaxID=2706888 RepID=A0A6B2LYK9_9BACT|nr:arylsulfatase [Oceanipulchritudo coccoides]NDV61014.1 arylsulfatase [Oceanipulchritudo coccoides]
MKRFLIISLLGLMQTAFGGTPPNVIYILADDLGYGDLSTYGQTHFKTPNIDSIADNGIKFSQHYSGAPVCAPSRSTLMTGLHTGHAPIRGNGFVDPEGQMPMPADTYTVGHLFQQAGYSTGLFGKWGLGDPESASEPLKMGFERFYGYNCQRQAHHYYPYYLWDDDQRVMLWENFGYERGEYAPDLIQDEVLGFIEANKDKPFFCYYALVQPHAEMFAPEPYMEKYRGKFLPESSYEGTDSGPDFRKYAYGSQPEAHAAFAAMVSVMDDDVGEIMAKLEELGIADNTLVIFTSDNGPHQEGGHDPEYFNSSGSLRGFKRDLYEGGIRVPMIASWPGKIEPGTQTDHVSAFWDVLPTMADVLGQKLSVEVDGVSFLPTLLGAESQASSPMYWEFHEKKGRIALRKGNWKAVRYNVAVDPDSPLELYDLCQDPSEQKNIADQYPEIVAELDGLIGSARTTSPVTDFNFPLKRNAPSGAMAHEK